MKTVNYRTSIFANGKLRFITFRNTLAESKDFAAKTIAARLDGENGRVVIAERGGEDHASEIEALGRSVNVAPALYLRAISMDMGDKEERIILSEAF